MIDIHSHIIPNVDDGAKSIDESIKMLEDETDEEEIGGNGNGIDS